MEYDVAFHATESFKELQTAIRLTLDRNNLILKTFSLYANLYAFCSEAFIQTIRCFKIEVIDFFY